MEVSEFDSDLPGSMRYSVRLVESDRLTAPSCVRRRRAGLVKSFFTSSAAGREGSAKGKAWGDGAGGQACCAPHAVSIRFVSLAASGVHGDGNVRARWPTRRGVADHVAVRLTGIRPFGRSGVWPGRRTCSCGLDG
jgi:hypothetical protein